MCSIAAVTHEAGGAGVLASGAGFLLFLAVVLGLGAGSSASLGTAKTDNLSAIGMLWHFTQRASEIQKLCHVGAILVPY